MICGVEGRFARHLRDVTHIIGQRAGRDRDLSALSMLITQRGAIFLHRHLCDDRPDGRGDRRDDACWRPRRSAASASSRRRRCCRSPISARATRRARMKMRSAAEILRSIAPDLQVDGEMHADTAAFGDAAPARLSRIRR